VSSLASLAAGTTPWKNVVLLSGAKQGSKDERSESSGGEKLPEAPEALPVNRASLRSARMLAGSPAFPRLAR